MVRLGMSRAGITEISGSCLRGRVGLGVETESGVETVKSVCAGSSALSSLIAYRRSLQLPFTWCWWDLILSSTAAFYLLIIILLVLLFV